MQILELVCLLDEEAIYYLANNNGKYLLITYYWSDTVQSSLHVNTLNSLMKRC